MEKNFSNCKKCGAEIGWMVNYNNKPIPVDADSIDDDTKYRMKKGLKVFFKSFKHKSHFETCQYAPSFRKRRYEKVDRPPVPYKED